MVYSLFLIKDNPANPKNINLYNTKIILILRTLNAIIFVIFGITVHFFLASGCGSKPSNEIILPDSSSVPPTIASVTIKPKSGYVKVGDAVEIIVTAGNREVGLKPSKATINGIKIPLRDRGNGTYTGTYVVFEGDNKNTDVEVTNITLTGKGGTSEPASSIGDSLITLTIDGKTPSISWVTINPDDGWIKTGDTVDIIVKESNEEAGLIASNATINFQDISLSDQGDGTYKGTYTVEAGDNQIEFIETWRDTTYVLTGELDHSYALEVKPVNSTGNVLGVLRSRYILCSPADMDVPGKPELVDYE